jgi:tRNA dimethylallyltransferase
MIDIESIASPINAAQFIERAEKIIIDLLENKKIVILVGGSAFYLRALLKGMYESHTPSEELKTRLNDLYKNLGIAPFLQILKEHDPESLNQLHHNDHYRIMRAVEHFEQTGSKISDQKKILDNDLPYDFSQNDKNWDVLHFYLDLPKDKHFEIIKSRTKLMIDQGLQKEIKNLLDHGFDINLKPLQSIGYKEMIAYINGEFENLEECMERINISTRQLAKSQRTFFNKITPKLSFDPTTDLQKMKSQLDLFIQG